ncbi:hypothetical protein N9L68_00195 [bacterium]|nr:hypothetical protein [bacterium]
MTIIPEAFSGISAVGFPRFGLAPHTAAACGRIRALDESLASAVAPAAALAQNTGKQTIVDCSYGPGASADKRQMHTGDYIGPMEREFAVYSMACWGISLTSRSRQASFTL